MPLTLARQISGPALNINILPVSSLTEYNANVSTIENSIIPAIGDEILGGRSIIKLKIKNSRSVPSLLNLD